MIHTQLQQRWQAYEDHAEKVKRQEENEREKELAEKAKRMRRREKLFILLQNREEGILNSSLVPGAGDEAKLTANDTKFKL